MGLVNSTFAGSWYPGTRKQIEAKLAEFAAQVKKPQKLKKPPVAGVVPHAGWVYSGAVAYEVWANVAARKPDVVIMFGGHMQPFQRSVLFADEGFATPLGPVHCHPEIVEGLAGAFLFKGADAHSW